MSRCGARRIRRQREKIAVLHGGGGTVLDGVDLIFKVAAVGIVVAVLNQLLVRSGREDQAMMTTLAGLVVVLFVVINQISVLFDTIKSLFNL